VAICMTTVSLTHTQAKINAVKKGARIATMPFGSKSTEFVTRVFTGGGMTVDFEKMDANIRRLAGRLEGAGQARITTKKGTDLTIDLAGRKFYMDTGIARMPGRFTNLPAGELFIAPVSANGVAVIDVTMGRLGKLMSPLTLTFKGGIVTSIEGERSKELESLLGSFGPNARKIAELGIGMNPKARVCGLLVEDEKVGNTVHVALGDSHGFGGDVHIGLHVDGVMSGPGLAFDGENIDVGDYLH
jgi:aminopeptidase